ncbi:transposase [Cognataquiflexum nitidum]
MNISKPFLSSIIQNFKNPSINFDKFHVVKFFNEAMIR